MADSILNASINSFIRGNKKGFNMVKLRPLRSFPLRVLTKILHSTQLTFGMGSITHAETHEPLVAITFDGGPDERWTPKVLDVMSEYQAKGTFFVIGKYVQKHPDIMQRLVDEGHELGNHTWDHPSMPLLPGHKRRKQIYECDEALKPYGANIRLFRPPYYDQSMASRFDMFRLGYSVIIGNRVANDWEDRDTKFILDRLKSTITGGDIVLLHDAVCDQRYRSRAAMIRALSLFLSQCHNRFRFITVSELLRSGKPKKEIWLKKPNLKRFATYERDI